MKIRPMDARIGTEQPDRHGARGKDYFFGCVGADITHNLPAVLIFEFLQVGVRIFDDCSEFSEFLHGVSISCGMLLNPA